jgi:hypothetical protein
LSRAASALAFGAASIVGTIGRVASRERRRMAVSFV